MILKYLQMKKVYLDNAATTSLFDEVVEKMAAVSKNAYGNPSSTHFFGREAKTLLEKVRKQVAAYLNVTASEIIFTCSGTEANNMILKSAVTDLDVKSIISSPVEHHAVGYVLQEIEKQGTAAVHYVNLDQKGNVDFLHLEDLLARSKGKTLVSLMAINNEIGNKLNLQKTSELCKQYYALFHSDAIQLVGHYRLDLQEIPIDFITASAHKFHGPKGVGFAYLKKGYKLSPMIIGGGQEKGLRAGTENVVGVVGLGVALEHSLKDLERDMQNIKQIKKYCIKALKAHIPQIAFNGNCEDLENSSPLVLSVRLPFSNPMLKFQMDMKGVAVSGGSACQSGSSKGSHVLEALGVNQNQTTTLRVSFSKFTSLAEIDYFVQTLKSFL